MSVQKEQDIHVYRSIEPGGRSPSEAAHVVLGATCRAQRGRGRATGSAVLLCCSHACVGQIRVVGIWVVEGKKQKPRDSKSIPSAPPTQLTRRGSTREALEKKQINESNRAMKNWGSTSSTASWIGFLVFPSFSPALRPCEAYTRSSNCMQEAARCFLPMCMRPPPLGRRRRVSATPPKLPSI